MLTEWNTRAQNRKFVASYSQTTLLSIQDSKKTRNNSSTESINHSLRLRLTHAHLARYIAHL